MTKKIKAYIKWAFLSIILCVVAVFIFLQLPFVQNYIAGEVVEQVNKQLNTPVHIEKIGIRFFNRLHVKNAFWGTPRRDTLVYIDQIVISLKVRELLNKTVHIKKVKLKGSTIRLHKAKNDSVWNIVKALGNGPGNKNDSADTAATPYQFVLHKLLLKEVDFSMEEVEPLSRMDLQLDDFRMDWQQFNPSKKEIHVKSITANGIWFSSAAEPTTNSKTQAKPIEYDITIADELNVKNLHVLLKNLSTGEQTQVKQAAITVKPTTIDLSNKQIDLANLTIANAQVILENTVADTISDEHMATPQKIEETVSSSWMVQSRSVILEKNSVLMKTFAGDSLQSQLSMQDINSKISGVAVGDKNYRAVIETMALTINEQVQIKDFSAGLSVNNSSAELQNARLISDSSQLDISARLSYSNLAELSVYPEKTKVLVVANARLHPNELVHFIPDSLLQKSLPEINVTSSLHGTLQKIMIDSFKVNSIGLFHLKMKGSLENITNPDKLVYAVKMEQLLLNPSQMQFYLAHSFLPGNIIFPDSLLLTGSADGSSRLINSTLAIQSSFGDLTSSLVLNHDSIAKKEVFNLRSEVTDLNLGRILNKSDTLGLLSLKTSLDGQLDKAFKHPYATIDMQIEQFDFLQYTYNNMQINGDYQKGHFNGNFFISDTNLKLSFNGKVKKTEETQEYNFHLDLQQANLKALHISWDSNSISGKLNVNLKGTDWQSLQGNLASHHLSYRNSTQHVKIDSMRGDFTQGKDSALYNLQTYSIRLNDSLLVNTAKLAAVLQENRVNFSYRTLKNNSLKDTLSSSFFGNGYVTYGNDTLEANAKLVLALSRLHDSLQYKLHFMKSQKLQQENNFSLSFKGNGANLRSSGKLPDSTNNDLNVSVNVDSFDLDLLAPFAKQYLAELKGNVRGDFTLSKRAQKLNMDGAITLMETTLRPQALNTNFKFKNEEITFSNNRLKFDKVAIYDNGGNKAVLNGSVNISKQAAENFDLTLTANRFQLLNKPALEATLYYGSVTANIDARVKGTFSTPVIDLETTFPTTSNFAFIVPQAKTREQQQDKLMVFVDSLGSSDLVRDSTRVGGQELPGNTSNLNLTTNLDISDKLSITLVTDPAANENLTIRGNGNLSFVIDQTSSLKLSGRYEITEGSYHLRLYELVERDFQIQQGSYLNWSGEILEANANIVAIYKTRTPISGLLQSQVTESPRDMGELNTNPVGVKVLLTITGNLLSPAINFDIEVDEEYQSGAIQSALAQLNRDESEVNKQAFSLLVFNSFLNEGNGQNTQVSYELQNTARQSVSSLLSQQLNRFSNQYIKGVDVSVNIDSYNRYQENTLSPRTDVSVGVSRNLLNDRLLVRVGGRVALDENSGETSSEVASNNLAGDFLVEYKITSDGTYRLQAFNKNEYENEIDGEVSKTGISFLFNKDFYKLRDLFGSKKEEN